LCKQRRYLTAEYQDRRSEDQLPEWIQPLSIPARRLPAVWDAQDDAQAVRDGFALVDWF
jgi:hypothetical protein